MPSFNPSKEFSDPAEERDWPMKLSMLDWDDTKIVFTKRQLVDFLKYTGVTIDPNYKTISKLPRYAEFGTMSTEEADADTEEELASPTSTAGVGAASDPAFRPTRKVRTAPGGASSVQSILAETEAPDDVYSTAPAMHSPEASPSKMAASTQQSPEGKAPFRPSRRVRHAPGGPSSLGPNMFSGEDEAPQEFKPTRKVRSRPGGDDHINDFFS
ncbi:hypothetical protein BOTBODRAFT_29447 [Botryobasidium botryosum FD-172 SS1]|uniref:Uncharacterized protein n=1 Tax=Botryobasidium botryosum (strain FD-172 SS1) TaxID=930990 RepID=A0A067N2W1_BOTB1|nr:hypothetical protein BOTBODRAFT_29447 [Botryobasidium botryosum FD-172 SS1]